LKRKKGENFFLKKNMIDVSCTFKREDVSGSQGETKTKTHWAWKALLVILGLFVVLAFGNLIVTIVKDPANTTDIPEGHDRQAQELLRQQQQRQQQYIDEASPGSIMPIGRKFSPRATFSRMSTD